MKSRIIYVGQEYLKPFTCVQAIKLSFIRK